MPLLTVPFQLALGTNLTLVLASAAKSRAVLTVGLPKAVQFVPPLVVYCHVPLVLSTAVTAIPSTALSGSLAFPEISAETSVPLLVVGSSLIVVRLFAPERVGA